MSRFVKRGTAVLTISGGDTLTVNRRLSAGEQRRMFSRMAVQASDGSMKVNPLEVSLGMITAYLVDWSLKDEHGKPVTIAGLEPDQLVQVLDDLDPESFAEIREAIEKHNESMHAERDAEKNGKGGETSTPVVSPSPVPITGDSMTYSTSMPTSTIYSLNS